MGTRSTTESEFNALQFEKTLISLKDSQESINSCCKWCLENRAHHKKIVNSWLNVLKRVKVEQRLILFYLANDVVQYSKRRNYEYVESWGTALQKATTMVRDEKVKHKVLRIFKIWEQRNVYNEEFISDLCGLLNVVPTGSKNDEPHEFQPTYVINKIKSCSKLEKDTDAKLKLLKEHNTKIQFDDNLLSSLKDRAHIDDVEKEIETYVQHMESWINALKLEIKTRINLISVLKQAETQLESDRKDVKIVANAYRMFGTRVKTFQRKLEEHKESFNSPIPSPDVNAPSPSSNSDLDLPDDNTIESIHKKKEETSSYNPKVELQMAGYYTPQVTPVPTTSPLKENTNSFLKNGFSSFIGSDMHFNLKGSDFQQNSSNNHPPPLPVEAPPTAPATPTNAYPYGNNHMPLLPPPLPPFTKSQDDYGSFSIDAKQYDSYSSTMYNTTAAYATPQNNTTVFDAGANAYSSNDEYNPEEYNPEETSELWQSDPEWNNIGPPSQLDTPESPPMFEKEGYADPVEYHDNMVQTGVQDIDHRILPTPELDNSLGSNLGGKDVDHRNLISLTGSPARSSSGSNSVNSWARTDQDYRIPKGGGKQQRSSLDQDYRMGFSIQQLKLPPPPPPPPNATPAPPSELANVKKHESIDNIDMDLSEDDCVQTKNDNLKVIVDGCLQPPPPLPDLPDDIDANNFLDELSNDLHEFSNLSDELSNNISNEVNVWGSQQSQGLLPTPGAPVVNFNEFMSLPPPGDKNCSHLSDGGVGMNIPPLMGPPVMPPTGGEQWPPVEGEHWNMGNEEYPTVEDENYWMGHSNNSNNSFAFRSRGVSGNRGNNFKKNRGNRGGNHMNKGRSSRGSNFQPRGGRGGGNWNNRGSYRGNNYRAGF